MGRSARGDVTRPRYAALLFMGLLLAGLAGNYFKFPLFLNIDLLFGSIFALLALQFFGLRRGVLASAVIASYTWVLWNHPYAVIILTAEVLVVGTLMARRQMGMVLADALYWIVIGMPLVYIFYHLVMQVPMGSTTLIMVKQAVNGIANALLARLIFTGLALHMHTAQTSFREVLYNLLAAFVLVPTLLILALDSRSDFVAADDHARANLQEKSLRLNARLQGWLQDRVRVVVHLSSVAPMLSPGQMQTRLAQALASDQNLLRIGMRDKDSVVTAYAPALDESGQSNVGKKFPERPYISELRRTLKPMLAEVVIGRIDTPEPIANLLAPVVKQGVYRGYVNLVLNLGYLQGILQQAIGADALVYSLLDKNGNLVLSNRTDQTMMTPLRRGPGVLKPIDANTSQWLPALPANTSLSEQWRQSFYVTQVGVGALSEWQLVLEQPVAPIQKMLYDSYSRKLMWLFAILLAALAIAEFLSRRSMRTLELLSELTHRLPGRLTNPGAVIDWPDSSVRESRRLIDNFRQMADSLMTQFDAARRANATLEERVAQRTRELQISEDKHRQLIDNSHDIIYTLNAAGVFTFVSAAWTALLGHPVAQVVGRAFIPFVHPDDVAACSAALHNLFESGQRQTGIEYRVLHLDGSWRWHSSNAMPLTDATGKVTGFEGTAMDITERKQVQDQVRQLAFHDALTQLPNRRLFSDRLGQALLAGKRTGVYGAVMFIDLDNFKPLNDVHGHAAGDLLLAQVALRLKSCVRERDTVARVGGDEFVVMLGELDVDRTRSLAQASVIAEKIRRSLCEPYRLINQDEGRAVTLRDHHCTASIGVVLFMGDEASQDEILKWADVAMYQAKNEGRNAVSFHVATGPENL